MEFSFVTESDEQIPEAALRAVMSHATVPISIKNAAIDRALCRRQSSHRELTLGHT
jgi:hypothetical protein